MVLASLASIDNLSLQRPSVSIASHRDRMCGGTSLVTLNLRVNVSPCAACLSAEFGKVGIELKF
jgi:hypothetical protein